MATSIDNLGVQFRAIAKGSWDASKAQDNVFYSVQNSDNSYDLYLGKQLLSNQDEVNAAVGRIATSEQNIQALQAIVAGLEGTTVVKYVTDAIAALDSGALAQQVEANKTAIGVINNTTIPNAITTAGTNADKKISAYDTATVQPIKSKVDTLIGSDSGKSAREIANDEINTLVGGANSADTIQNVKDLVDYVNNNASDLGAVITESGQNKTKIDAVIAGTTKAGDAKKLDGHDSDYFAVKETVNAELVKKANAENVYDKTAMDELLADKANKNDVYDKDTADGRFATAAQGSKADSALQKADITTGVTAGTIKVDGTEVKVAGLGTAAYQNVGAFDASGAAAAVLGTASDSKDAATVYGAKAYAKDIAIDATASALNLAKQHSDQALAEALTWKALSTM